MPARQVEQGPSREIGLVAELAEHPRRLVGVALGGERLGQTELDGERDQVLLGAVVDVALEAAALRVVCRHDPSPGGPQLVGPQRELLHALLQVAREPDVANDDARLRGEVLQELLLGGR